MATPRCPWFPAASGRRREGTGFLAQAQTFLLSQQGAIEALRRDVAAMGTPRRKVFSTAGLDKCDLDMSAADFRTWRRSLEDWIELNAVGDGDAARYIQLLCAPELQKVLDARYPKAQWDATSAAEALESVGSLRSYCVAFEAAQRDAHGFPPNRHPGAAASDTLSGATSDDDVIAAAGPRKARNRPCGYCGERHQPGKASCPAANATCRACGKLGHFQAVCKGERKPARKSTVASAVVATAKVTRQPQLQILVSRPEGGPQHPTTAIADTGAQVCVAGPTLLRILGLSPRQMQERAGLRDLAGINLPTLGATTCHFSIPGRSTQRDVYFVKSVDKIYLSLDACKDLGLVHTDFPQPPVREVASVSGSGPTPPSRPAAAPPRPNTMPLPPLEENVPMLQEWLLGHFSTSTFDTDQARASAGDDVVCSLEPVYGFRTRPARHGVSLVLEHASSQVFEVLLVHVPTDLCDGLLQATN
ncbi:hypothetical protein O3P69_018484 [Scylla paramamosain]|uniref:CCHC-type domain-containing protein n=1 Tax=Scylla paramamosain TaxID=85552 RepID=A0AAW0T1S7_SCYPA